MDNYVKIILKGYKLCNKSLKKKNKIVIIISAVLSFIIGLFSHDLLMGGTILFTGLLCAYYASEGKKCNYILGFINYVLMGIVSYVNHLYGLFFFYLFLFAPLQIRGYLSWNKSLDVEDKVVVRKLTLFNGFIVLFSCVVGSIALGYLLTFNRMQRLAFLDATSNCINLCGVVLMIMRYRESWWLWILNNSIDLMIWIVTYIQGGKGSFMMLLVSIAYFLINLYGIVKWNVEKK